jgi:hypothetical protein
MTPATATAAPATHIGRARRQALTTQQRVQQLIGIGAGLHGKMIFQTGIDYLKLVCLGDEQDVSRISQSPIFWGWWRNHWQARDEAFLTELADEPSPRRRRIHYVNLHHPVLLFEEIGYYGVLLGQSYAGIIGLIVRDKGPQMA